MNITKIWYIIKEFVSIILYTYHTNKDVYYVPFTTAEVFSGINKLNINKIEGVYESLSYSDIAKLVNKLIQISK